MKHRIISTIAFSFLAFIFCVTAWGQVVQPHGGGGSIPEKIASFSFDGGGTAIPTTGTKRCVRVHAAATIVAYSLELSQSATVVFKVYMGTYSTTTLPTADITNGGYVTTTAALSKISDNDTNFASWTTVVPAGEVICAECTTNDNAVWATLVLHGK